MSVEPSGANDLGGGSTRFKVARWRWEGKTFGVDIAERVAGALSHHPAVKSVTLVGSRAQGSPTPLSDWDFKVDTDNFGKLASDLPGLVSDLDPLARMWDPITGGESCYMLILDGPTKVDLIFDHPHTNDPPWTVSSRTLRAIDDHFWDWTLWLCAKQAAQKTELVTRELEKMFEHLLRPMGGTRVPADISAAVADYRRLRAEREAQFRAIVPRRLDEAVSAVVCSS